MNDDPELLRRYAEDKSEAAFAELVRRHLNLVYGVALRRVGGDAHRAEDVTQQVFTALARKAESLACHPVLSGWLYTTTRNVAAQAVRTARRQQQREQAANTMNPESSSPEWEKLRPVLDDVLDELRDDDRQAVLLRFFEGRSFADVGARLRLTDNAARMRVERALEKMHAALGRRGVTSTTAALGLALAGQAAVTVPAGLANAVTGMALAGAGGAAAAGAVAAGTFMSITKVQIGLASAIAVAGATGYVVQAQNGRALQAELEGLRAQDSAMTTLRQVNEALRREAMEVADLRQDDVELARLRDEAEALRIQLQSSARTVANAATFEVNQVDQIPQAQMRTPPKYPFEMRQAGIGGEVLVDFIVDANGEVKNAYAAKSTRREFEAAAVEAVAQWTFRPGRKNQKQINTHMQVPIVFTLNSGAESGTPQTVPNPNNWF